ncbi:MAG: NAD-dependent epimerase/dehydratase family protein [Caldithrix sp.]|nr:MAG: NAD-dependent epimerase/dehydratase family protein [Caldithrix sp.]
MILVSGGAGVMGSQVVKELVKRGNKVRVLTIHNDPFVSRLDGVDCEIVYGDVSDADSMKGIFDGVKTIYHMAAIIITHDHSLFEKINTQGTRNMVEGGIAAGAEHFILVSSASVTYEHTTPYSISKKECERIVTEQDKMQYTIIRPTLAYNENGGQEYMMFLDYLKKYPIVPFIGKGEALKSPVHVDDLMKGFLAIPGNKKAYGKIYNFSGGDTLPIWDMAHLMLEHVKIKKPFLRIPIPICIWLAKVMGVFMKRPPLTWNSIAGIVQNANLDHSPATRDLGYKPIGFKEGLQKCFPI